MTPDDDVRELLRDAVSEVEPAPGLDRIRRRTQSRPVLRRTRTWLVVTAAAAAVAVIVGGIALADNVSHPATDGPTSHTGPAHAKVERALGIYYLGDTPQGARLYREFRRLAVPATGAPVGPALRAALSAPKDPDYRTSWPAGTSVGRVQVPGTGPATVSLSNSDVDLGERQAGMSEQEADESVQQLVYTAQAAMQERRPVRFRIDGKDVGSLLGVDVSAPVAERSQLEVLSLVSITDPAEGTVVRTSFVARGVASSFEANVPWQLTRSGRDVKSGYSTSDGWMGRLYPWQTGRIDVSRLAPGRYSFVAMTDDPSAGEGNGPMKDSRTIVVRH